MNSKVHNKILFAIDNIISRLAFALVLSVLISVLLAQVITTVSSSSDYATSKPVAFILPTH
jgi:hypothetical protein